MHKTWLITGASSGLGRQLTERLLERGDRVVATSRREGALDTLQVSYREHLTVLKLDLTDVPAIRSMVDYAFSSEGPIDIVVSNAGYGLLGAAEEVSDAQIDHQIATNLTGSIQLIRAALPNFRRQGGGRILQVSSEGGQIAYPSFSLYHATKWGIEGFIESVAQEVSPFGIDFIIAEPGPTATGFAAGLAHGETMQAYADTPAAAVQQALRQGTFVVKGSAVRTVDAMIAAADSDNPPLRLALGSTAYKSIRSALAHRLQALETQRGLAFSADSD